MSIKCMNWAWSLPLRPTTKLVLMSLSDVANDLGECFPSIKYIATRCCISTRHTRREIKKLVELELLGIETRYRNDGSKTSNLYLLSLPQIGSDNLSPPLSSSNQDSPDKVTPKPAGNDTQTLSLTTIEPSIKPTTTTTETTSLKWPAALSQADRSSIEKIAVGVPKDDVQEILDEISEKLGSIKSPVSYIFTLIKKHKEGTFVSASSNSVVSKREIKEATEARYQRQLQASEERALRMFEEHEKSNGFTS